MPTISKSGTSEAIVIIKAAPQIGLKHGETVCCAGIDRYGKWLRLYPVSFRHLADRRKFARWDRIKFDWRLPNDDRRPESRRIDQDSIEISGKLRPAERERFLASSIVTSLKREREGGRSLALLRPEVSDFIIDKKPPDEIEEDRKRFEALRAQGDLFAKESTPSRVCPYRFRYRYRTDDGERLGTCQDWETETTYFNWSRQYGESHALGEMQKVFGEEYPRKGMLLAMGTHSRYPDVWLINGVIRLPEVQQASLF